MKPWESQTWTNNCNFWNNTCWL